MRLVYATTVPLNEPTAPAHHVLASCEALHDLGNKVHLIYPKPEVEASDADHIHESQTVVAMPALRGGSRIMQAHLAWTLFRFDWTKVDLLYLRLVPSVPLLWALRSVGVPKALEINGNEIFDVPRFVELAKTMDLILVDSEPLSQRCLDRAGLPDSRVAVHMSPAYKPGCPSPWSQEEARRELGIDIDAAVIVHVSGFQPQHDFRTIVGGFRSLLSRRSHRTAKLVLIGDGPARPLVADQLVDLVESENVIMTGQLDMDGVERFIGASDVCINVLTPERLRDGNLRAYKLYEYLGAGRPVIEAVDMGLPIDNWAQEYLCLIPPDDPVALSSAISKVLEHPGEWTERADCGRDYLLKHRTWNKATKVTLEHLERLAEQHSGAASHRR